MVEASRRTQLIVTTHSEALIDALSDRHDVPVVCEQDFDNGTQFRRLDRKQLATWLERYARGTLAEGELGGAMVKEIRVYFEGDDALRPGFRGFLGEVADEHCTRSRKCRFRPASPLNATPVQDFRDALKSHPDAFNVLLLDADDVINLPLSEFCARKNLAGLSEQVSGQFQIMSPGSSPTRKDSRSITACVLTTAS